MKKLKIPLISYCGINYNNRKWSSHLIKCAICFKKHNELKEKEKEEWSYLCECGCGKTTNIGDKYLHGHWAKKHAKTLEWREKQRKKFKKDNPLFKKKNRKYGNNNPSKRKEVREKISKNNPMHNIQHRKKAIKNRKKVGYDKTIPYLKNRWKNKALLEKRIESYCKNLSEGKIKLKNNWKCGNFKKKNGEFEWYDSSYEEKRMVFFEKKGYFWTKKHKIRISYVNDKGIKTYYIPDFKIIDENNKIIIEEVKGWIKKNDIIKAKIGIEYCKKHNYSYRFLLGQNLEYQKELSYENI
jgi:hypothetical protein